MLFRFSVIKGCCVGGIIKKDNLAGLRLNLLAMHQLWTDALDEM